jgi:hypothetical protein
LCEPLGAAVTGGSSSGTGLFGIGSGIITRTSVGGDKRKIVGAGRLSSVDEGSSESGPRMGDELCEHLLQVLLETWLMSETDKVEMWGKLSVRLRYRD